jgi:hypothetical protein
MDNGFPIDDNYDVVKGIEDFLEVPIIREGGFKTESVGKLP